MLNDKHAGSGLHKRAVPCRRAAVYNLTLPATKATPWPANAPGMLPGDTVVGPHLRLRLAGLDALDRISPFY